MLKYHIVTYHRMVRNFRIEKQAEWWESKGTRKGLKLAKRLRYAIT